MSSPSSAGSTAGKRKRTAVQSAMDQLQPSSRDASGEDGEFTGPETTVLKHKKTNNSIESGNPPSKRLRSSDGGRIAITTNVDDPGEASDTTEDSASIATRVGRKGRDSEDEKTVAMAPPPLGSLTDPVGYKTNPPPTGRAVRVYADGVFDLFHLGYVHPLN
jgi:choline-phosphate cytidylyltransferase